MKAVKGVVSKWDRDVYRNLITHDYASNYELLRYFPELRFSAEVLVDNSYAYLPGFKPRTKEESLLVSQKRAVVTFDVFEAASRLDGGRVGYLFYSDLDTINFYMAKSARRKLKEAGLDSSLYRELVLWSRRCNGVRYYDFISGEMV